MTEIFKKIKGFEHYEVSNYGNVRSIDHITTQNNRGCIVNANYKGKIIKSRVNNSGYVTVGLHKDGKVHSKFVHRLVAEAFIDNTGNFPCINHKDCNKQNNFVDNLEWCSYSYNSKYNYIMGLSTSLRTEKQKNQWEKCAEIAHKNSKKRQKKIICNETNEVFENSRDCAKKMGIDRSSLCRHLTGRLVHNKYPVYHVCGYTFKYLKDEEG